jgi:multidrug efflux system membrane fusion protein
MTARARAALIRIVIALAVIGGVVWWLQTRGTKDGGTSVAAPDGSGQTAKSGGGKGGGKGGDRVVPVQVAAAARQALPIWLEGLGTVTAFQQVTVRSQVDGRLDKVLFEEGKPVKKGQVIAQIDPRPFMVQLHQAQGALARDRAQLDAAKKNLERYKGLQNDQLVAAGKVEEIQAQVGQFEGAVKIDQAQVEQAQLQLDYAQVKAPIDGITGVRIVDAGNIIKASDANGLVVITAIDPVAVMFTIPQDKLPAIAAAMQQSEVTVEIYNRDNTQKLAVGKVAVLDNQINQSTATLRLKALVPNPNRTLWPNAFVKVKMLVETRENALVIPAVAVQRGPQGTFVYTVAEDKTAKLVNVQVGLITGEVAMIEKGLEGGEQVVIEGQGQLRPGGRVEVVKPGGDKRGSGGQQGSGSTARR